MLDQMGSAPQLLGEAGNLAVQKQNQEANQQANTENQVAGSTNQLNQTIQNQRDLVTLSPELAKGLGDPKLAGTKWHQSVLAGMIHTRAMQQYHEDLISDRDKRDALDTEAKARDQKAKDDAAQKRKETATPKASGGSSKPAAGAKTPAPKMSPQDTEFMKTVRQYQKDIKGHEGDFFKSSEIKKKIKFVSDNQDRVDKIMGMGGDSDPNQAAVDYLKKNHPDLKNPSPEDIQWAQQKLKTNG